ncbi:hypothetical protein ACHAW5_004389 [Stephanodiscus triporus]|uniref:Uncharacterized protein n=1 Tax=Stephanodiscus triporus TaxID=2934178 RepID=A0ABD3QIK1_9STRA
MPTQLIPYTGAPYTYWTSKGHSQLYSFEMMNLQRQLRQWASYLNTRRFADGELFIELSPDCHHSMLVEGILLYDDALLPLWKNFCDGLAAMTSISPQKFLLIIQDVQLSRSVLSLLSPVLNQAQIAGLLLRNNMLPRRGIRCLTKFLKRSPHLKCLAACNELESNETCIAFAEAVKQHPSIESLILHQIGLGHNRSLMTSIMPSLHNRTLEAVSLGNNNIDSFGAGLIADFLKANPTLKTLHLDKNLLSDDDVALLAESLTTNTNLVELNLHENQFGACGVNALLRCVYNKISLNAIHDSNHTCHIKFPAEQCGELLTEDEFNVIFNPNGESPIIRKQAKIALAICGATGSVNFLLLGDVPVRLMPHALALMAVLNADAVCRCPSILDLVTQVLSGWNMPWLFTHHRSRGGWRSQGMLLRSKRGRNTSLCVPLRRSARLRIE